MPPVSEPSADNADTDEFNPGIEDFILAIDESSPDIAAINPDIANADDVLQSSCASGNCEVSVGDPHITTLDGLRYSFQTVGEFVFAKSDDNQIEIQTRHSPIGESTTVSLNSDLAVNLAGTKVNLQRSDGNHERWVDDVTFGSFGTVNMTLPSGANISRSIRRLVLSWPDGSVLNVTFRGSFLNYYFAPSSNHAGAISGLVGDFDNDTVNDLRLSDGTSLDQPIDLNRLHMEFADAHRINHLNSLFIYGENENTDTFTDKSFPAKITTLADFTVEQRENARQICVEAGITQESYIQTCMFDVLATGDNAFANLLPALNPTTPSSPGFAFIDVPQITNDGIVNGTAIISEAANVRGLSIVRNPLGSNNFTTLDRFTPTESGAYGINFSYWSTNAVDAYELRSTARGVLSTDIVINQRDAILEFESGTSSSADRIDTRFEFGEVNELANPRLRIFDETTRQAVTGNIPFISLRLDDGSLVPVADGDPRYTGEFNGSFRLPRDRFPEGPGRYIVTLTISYKRTPTTGFEALTAASRISFQ